jgi:hypothetical protein
METSLSRNFLIDVSNELVAGRAISRIGIDSLRAAEFEHSEESLQSAQLNLHTSATIPQTYSDYLTGKVARPMFACVWNLRVPDSSGD